MIDFFESNLRGKTFVFMLDPRVKSLSLLLIFLSLLLIKHIEFYFIWLIVMLFALLYNRIQIRFIFRPLKFFIWLFILTIFFHAFLTPGKVLFNAGKIFLTSEGIEKGIFFSFRLFLIVSFTYLFSLTTNPMDIADGLSKLFSGLRKLKIPVDDLSIIIHTSLRFIPTLSDQTSKILLSQKARGLNFDVGLLKKVKHLPSLILPIMMLSIKRAGELALALEARGYHPGRKRTSFVEMKLKTVDFSTFLVIFFFSAGIQFCEILR